MKKLIDKLVLEQYLSFDELCTLLSGYTDDDRAYAAEIARRISLKNFDNKIFIRGLIEISSFCKNDCLYCGLRKSNKNAQRYRLSKEDILSCCNIGYELGFRTFVLQGGEDKYYSDDLMCDVVSEIKRCYPDCAITLSLGEKQRNSYQKLYDAGADRYLLRHETADEVHYSKLHPEELSLKNRIRCLNDLKDIGFQTGCGFMVGSPYQTVCDIAKDLLFINEFKPQMVGVGPFIPHKDTPFKEFKHGNLEMTLFLLSLIRIMHPKVLLPSTTALATIHKEGRQLGILAGANVVMPNLSPSDVRKKYLLYDNKVSTGDEAAESLKSLEIKMKEIGYEIIVSRGDYKD
ncbi:MAG: [Clostridia bacterium]|nr:[FeFe] hydrogenase H-cluster radical SAM maturase HydE [Clostridia bacterium]